jgi:hypothetical protein
MHNSIINFKTQNIQKNAKSKNNNSKLMSNIQKNLKLT